MSDSYNFGQSSCWTWEENMKFEFALVDQVYESEPYQWDKIALTIPGKSALDVEKHYNDLVSYIADHMKAGLTDVPRYAEDHQSFSKGKFVSKSTQKSPRKSLDGLNPCCKGDWKKISEKYLYTKTDLNQVAYLSQEFFLHQSKDKTKKKRQAFWTQPPQVKQKINSIEKILTPSNLKI